MIKKLLVKLKTFFELEREGKVEELVVESAMMGAVNAMKEGKKVRRKCVIDVGYLHIIVTEDGVPIKPSLVEWFEASRRYEE